MMATTDHAAVVAAAAAPLVAMRGICKSFGEAVVLRDVDLDLFAGEVHALLGENGAGKSTLVKILIGVHHPDRGSIALDGVDITAHSVHANLRGGIAMIYQELSLLPNLTVAENLLLGREPRRPGWRVDYRGLRRLGQELLDRYGFPIDARARVETLGFAQRQMVEIVKAVSRGARVLVMDEPTSSLTIREEHKLFAIIEDLKRAGIGIIYISHRMSEIFQISDRISVIKDGRLLPTVMTAQSDTRQIAEVMSRAGTARPTAAALPQPVPAAGAAVSALRIDALRTAEKLAHGIDLSIARGEIVGIAGLVGSGRSTLAKALFGLLPDVSGTVEVEGRRLAPGSPAAAIAAGMGFVPEDRRGQGLIVEHGLATNIALPNLAALRLGGRWPILLPSCADALFDRFRKELRIACRGPGQPAGELSGGNQQKVVVAKWLATSPRLLILDEPTAGVDVNAKAEMRGLVRAAADAGVGVLIIASELEELVIVADRIITMVEGRFARDLGRVESEAELRAALQADVAAERAQRVH